MKQIVNANDQALDLGKNCRQEKEMDGWMDGWMDREIDLSAIFGGYGADFFGKITRKYAVNVRFLFSGTAVHGQAKNSMWELQNATKKICVKPFPPNSEGWIADKLIVTIPGDSKKRPFFPLVGDHDSPLKGVTSPSQKDHKELPGNYAILFQIESKSLLSLLASP